MIERALPHAVMPPVASLRPVTIPRPADLRQFQLSQRRLEERHIVGFHSRDIRSRAFNLMRSQVVKRLATHDWHLLGVTSPAPGAGKSFLSLNLAAALSRLTDRTVYLFDFDLRRGSLARELGIENGPGLGEFLQGETDELASIGYRLGDPGFALFPCFESLERSAELFVGPRFEALTAAMRALPDDAIVLCDLPPVFASDDTIVISQRLDAFLMVVEQGVTTRKQVAGAIDLLQPMPCAGSVLNRYDGGWSDPYGYAYGEKYAKYYG